MKNKGNKRKKSDNLGDNEKKKKQWRKYEKKGKKIKCDNLDDEKKGTFEKRGQQKKNKKSVIT